MGFMQPQRQTLGDETLSSKTSDSCLSVAAGRNAGGSASRRDIGLGRFFEPRAYARRGGLLLRLRQFQELCRLRKDVRAAEVCLALVGDDVRQAARDAKER